MKMIKQMMAALMALISMTFAMLKPMFGVRKSMQMAAVLAAVFLVAVFASPPVRAATAQSMNSLPAGQYGANYMVEYTADDLTTTTTNTSQVFTNTVVFVSNTAARLVWAQVVNPAVGPTNWTYSLLVQVGDSAVSNRYLTWSELASASGPDRLQFPVPAVQTGTPSATNGLVLPTVVTNIALPSRDHSASTGLRVEFKPNAENNVAVATGLVYRLYFWVSPNGNRGSQAPGP